MTTNVNTDAHGNQLQVGDVIFYSASNEPGTGVVTKFGKSRISVVSVPIHTEYDGQSGHYISKPFVRIRVLRRHLVGSSYPLYQTPVLEFDMTNPRFHIPYPAAFEVLKGTANLMDLPGLLEIASQIKNWLDQLPDDQTLGGIYTKEMSVNEIAVVYWEALVVKSSALPYRSIKIAI